MWWEDTHSVLPLFSIVLVAVTLLAFLALAVRAMQPKVVEPLRRTVKEATQQLVPQSHPIAVSPKAVDDVAQHDSEAGQQPEPLDEVVGVSQPEKDKIEILVLVPGTVPPDTNFHVHVNIQNFTEAPHDAWQSDGHAFETVVTAVKQGALVGLVMEATSHGSEDPLRFDVAYQAITWGRKNIVATFPVRSPAVNTKTSRASRLWIINNRVPIARIDFIVTIDPLARTVAPGAQYRGSVEQDLLTGDAESRKGEARASIFAKAFVCHAHDNWRFVRNLGKSLEAGGIQVLIDALDMQPRPHWLKQVEGWLPKVDLVYICWSQRAATSDSILSELDLIMREKEARGSREFGIVVLSLEDEAPSPPEWTKQGEGWSKRWEFFGAGHLSQERERASTSQDAK